MPITLAEYLIFVRNDGIPAILIDNNYFYNIICIKHVEALKGNHYDNFKVIHVSYVAITPIIVDPDVKIPMNLLSITHFPNIITTISIPPNPKDPLEPLGGVIVVVMQLVVPYSKPFKRPLNYLEYKKTLIGMLMYKYSIFLAKLTVKQ
jgi:hypothetical protein